MARASEQQVLRFDRELDVRGLGCPLPALRARAALSGMERGQVLRIVANDPGSRRDFELFAKKTGHAIVAQSAARKEFVFYLRRA